VLKFERVGGNGEAFSSRKNREIK